MNKTMAYKMYIMISSKHHLNWSANKIEMYSNKNIKILFGKYWPAVYLRTVYTLNNVTEAVTSSTMGPRLVMIPLDTVSGLVVLVESRDDCLLTSGEAISTSQDATSFSKWYIKISTFNENYSSPIKNTHSFSFLSPKKFNQVLE